MSTQRVAISAGHSTKCRGASDILDEVDEAWRVVRRVGSVLETRGLKAWTFQDQTSTDQQTNLETICAWHNGLERDLDVSVHFNSTGEGRRAEPIGTECLYVTQDELAELVSAAISVSGLIDRGAKFRDELYFLNHTDKPAILVEVCFVDSEADAAIYRRAFNLICNAIVDAIIGEGYTMPDQPASPATVLLDVIGKVSSFGGPDDMGVAPDEGLAFISDLAQAPHLFLPYQPDGTSGLARRLNSKAVNYIACRWSYEDTPKSMLLEKVALVRAIKTGVALKAFPCDWGPSESTGRVADLSPCLMDALGIQTDMEVQVIFPYEAEV